MDSLNQFFKRFSIAILIGVIIGIVISWIISGIIAFIITVLGIAIVVFMLYTFIFRRRE
jgi:hypothetical protein